MGRSKCFIKEVLERDVFKVADPKLHHFRHPKVGLGGNLRTNIFVRWRTVVFVESP